MRVKFRGLARIKREIPVPVEPANGLTCGKPRIHWNTWYRHTGCSYLLWKALWPAIGGPVRRNYL